MKKSGIIYLLGFVVLLASCKKDKPTSLYVGYDYFPNNVGHWVEYQVDSISFNPLVNSGVDTFRYNILEVIDSFYTDNTGARTQVIIRYKRPLNSSGTWTYQKTWTGNLTPTEAIRTEDGVKYVKLVFPVTQYSTWNGGAFSALPDNYFQWDDTSFEYTSVNTAGYVNWNNFDSTLTVLQDSETNLETHRFYLEQYATGVGRIYRTIIDIEANYIIGVDPFSGMDSLYTPADYPILAKENRIKQGSVLFTETYIASGN